MFQPKSIRLEDYFLLFPTVMYVCTCRCVCISGINFRTKNIPNSYRILPKTFILYLYILKLNKYLLKEWMDQWIILESILDPPFNGTWNSKITSCFHPRLSWGLLYGVFIFIMALFLALIIKSVQFVILTGFMAIFTLFFLYGLSLVSWWIKLLSIQFTNLP